MNEPTSSPDRGPRDWREREGARRAIDTGTVIWGLILIAVGAWFFACTTRGVDMPDIDWASTWPIILVVIGGAVIIQGLGRRDR